MSDKETAPHFQLPPDHATREELIGALEYWVIRAKTAERVALERTAPAPQPCGKNMGNDLLVIPCDLPRDHKGPCERNVWPVNVAATPQVTPELELEQEADGRWLAAYTRFPGVAAYGPSKEEAIRNAAKVLIESEQASPTPEQSRNTGVSLDGGKTIHPKFKND